MSTTTTVDTNEGWTFADNNSPSKIPVTTEQSNDWGIAVQATSTDGSDAPPTAPSPPLSAIGQLRTNNHASLHWTSCYDKYYGVHRQMKENNYYPQRSSGRCRRNHQMCDCPMPHPDELLHVTRKQHLNPVKASVDWHRGKWVCPECWFLVNMENHHLR